ncbi:hypothetical protein [Helicobacter apodemus]|uniref:hypothetical protein n=1 Tax=Helicobacter apodemus TaxID=135569 RepID=UPI001EF38B2D|nr:hypothetical protein [Helicobacter apodemus]
MNAWVLLALAIICEILASNLLKQVSVSGKHFLFLFCHFYEQQFCIALLCYEKH